MLSQVKERALAAAAFAVFAAVAGVSGALFEWKALLICAALLALAVALFSPTLALYLFIFSVPMTEIYSSGERAGAGITFFTLAALLASIALALPRYFNRDNLGIGTGWAWFLLMLAFSLPGIAMAQNLDWSLYLLSSYVKLFVLFVAVAIVIKSKAHLSGALWAFVLGTTVQSLILVTAFLPQLLLSSALRLSGEVTNPNSVAMYALIAIPAAVHLVGESKGGISKLFLMIALPLMVFVAIATQSRSAWLALGVYFLWLFAVQLRRRPLAALGTAIAVVLFLGAVNYAFNNIIIFSFQKRISAATTRKLAALDESYNLKVRLDSYSAAWEMFLDHPLSGVGLGNFSEHASEYGRENLPSGMELNTHNMFLEVLTGSGAAAALCLVLVIVSAFAGCARAYRRGGELSKLALLLAIVVFLVFIHSMFHVALHMRPLYVVLGLTGALYKLAFAGARNYSAKQITNEQLLTDANGAGA